MNKQLLRTPTNSPSHLPYPWCVLPSLLSPRCVPAPVLLVLLPRICNTSQIVTVPSSSLPSSIFSGYLFYKINLTNLLMKAGKFLHSSLPIQSPKTSCIICLHSAYPNIIYYTCLSIVGLPLITKMQALTMHRPQLFLILNVVFTP